MRIMIDSTIIRAHQHAAGALKKYRNWYSRTRARKVESRGFSSKLHAARKSIERMFNKLTL